MRGLLDDLRFAVRSLSTSPTYALGLVLVLALGIGVNIAIFSLVDAVLFRRLPLERPGEIVRVFAANKAGDRLYNSSYPAYLQYRDQASAFAGMAAFSESGPVHLAAGAGQPERVEASVVTGNFFEVLAARPVAGRLFTADDDRAPGGHPVAVISDRLWRRRFGADPKAVGSLLRINTTPFTIVGVAPRGFVGVSFEHVADLWVPTAMVDAALPGLKSLKPLTRDGLSWIEIVGRLAPGLSAGDAQAQITAIAARRALSDPTNERDPSARVVPADDASIDPQRRGTVSRLAWLLVGVVTFVLLIACADAAGLLLARAERRSRELAIRVALGASRARIIRQVLCESLLLSTAGAALGVLLAMWLTDYLVAAAPDDFLIPLEAATAVLDARAMTFAAVAALATGVLFGLVPALRAARTDLVSSLKGEARMVAVGGRRLPLRSVLVSVQVALSAVLLIGAGLLARTLANAASVRPGFNPDSAVVATFELARQGYSADQSRRFSEQLLERLSGTPGLSSVAVARSVPIQGSGMRNSVVIEGYSPRAGEDMHADVNLISPAFFTVLQVPLLRGRLFDATDRREAPPVAIINRAFADRWWPGQDPIGKWIGDVDARVIGVVADMRTHSLREPAEPAVYRPTAQFSSSGLTVVARTTLSPAAAMRSIAAGVASLDKDLPLFGVRTLRDKLGASVAQERVLALLLSSFALLALVLSAAGLYSLISYSAQARTREWGIRIALGARSVDVLRQVHRQGVRLALAGLALGLVAAYWLTRLASGLLFGVAPTDPTTYAVAGGVLLVVAAGAGYLPARRATRVDPMAALRSE